MNTEGLFHSTLDKKFHDGLKTTRARLMYSRLCAEADRGLEMYQQFLDTQAGLSVSEKFAVLSTMFEKQFQAQKDAMVNSMLVEFEEGRLGAQASYLAQSVGR